MHSSYQEYLKSFKKCHSHESPEQCHQVVYLLVVFHVCQLINGPFYFRFIIIFLKLMSSTDFSTLDQDELQLPRKIKDFNEKKRPFRFIQDINSKLQKLQQRDTVEEQEMLILKNSSKSAEVHPQRTPPLAKFKTYKEKAFFCGKENQLTQDPEKIQGCLKNTVRKKLTIQKKQSDHDPLEGKGVIKLKDGQVIFGTWVNGDVQGEARIVYPNGDIYCGDTKNNLKHGKGTYKFQNRQRYEGDFRDGHFTGYGVLYDQFGEILYRGIWSNGHLVQNII